MEWQLTQGDLAVPGHTGHSSIDQMLRCGFRIAAVGALRGINGNIGSQGMVKSNQR
jgi:hypothetical protein